MTFEELPDQKEYGPELVGPFNRGDYYRITVDGYEIDGLCAVEQQDGWYLSIPSHNNFFGPYEKEAIEQMATPLAYAMVYAANKTFGRFTISLESKFTRLIGLRESPDEKRKSIKLVKSEEKTQ